MNHSTFLEINDSIVNWLFSLMALLKIYFNKNTLCNLYMVKFCHQKDEYRAKIQMLKKLI